MTQISRPFQIALVALGLFVLVWFVALHGHNPGAGGSGSSAPGSTSAPGAPSAAAEAKAAAAPTSIYRGAAPGLAGLSRAIAKAHGAVAQSQRDAKRVETSDPSNPSGSAASTSVSAPASAASSATGASQAATTAHAKRPSSTTKPAVHTAPAMQTAVERELRQGKTVLVLFWDPRGADDVAVRRELPAVRHALGARVAVHYAFASQVGAFGTITHAVQVNQTPTLLVVNTHGQTTTLTGLADAFSIEQAVAESRRS
ncbi:MAG TPA: hypothetical protein VES65_03200 [Solirubrobacteraceae bacterium]|nr:hypothetical protein [Solirubrobacteraceae bacterium]